MSVNTAAVAAAFSIFTTAAAAAVLMYEMSVMLVTARHLTKAGSQLKNPKPPNLYKMMLLSKCLKQKGFLTAQGLFETWGV
jgi:hypothetical protein